MKIIKYLIGLVLLISSFKAQSQLTKAELFEEMDSIYIVRTQEVAVDTYQTTTDNLIAYQFTGFLIGSNGQPQFRTRLVYVVDEGLGDNNPAYVEGGTDFRAKVNEFIDSNIGVAGIYAAIIIEFHEERKVAIVRASKVVATVQGYDYYECYLNSSGELVAQLINASYINDTLFN